MTHHSIRFGSRRIRLPGSRMVRAALGGALVLLGCLGFLPVLGFWMVPLGLAVLSVDMPVVRRWRRRAEVFTLRRWRARKPARQPDT